MDIEDDEAYCEICFASLELACPKCWRGWQPIETAPKDGTWVLLRGGVDRWVEPDSGGKTPPCVVAFWNTEKDCLGDPLNEWAYAHWDSDWRSMVVAPTHWMPLPDPSEA